MSEVRITIEKVVPADPVSVTYEIIFRQYLRDADVKAIVRAINEKATE